MNTAQSGGRSEMAEGPTDAIVIGAGVMGSGVAYFLAQEGARVTVIEKEAVASGASGVAAAMLGPAAEGDRRVELSDLSLRLHRELSSHLPEEAGADYGYRENDELLLALTPEQAIELKAREPAFQERRPEARWVEGQELFEIEPQLTREAIGAILVRQFQVIASRFTIALATAAERKGVEIRHGEVVGLVTEGTQAKGVRLKNGDAIAAGSVVIAAGPWSGDASEWTGVRMPVYPVRGQILSLLAPNPQLRAAILGPEMYLVHKADGMTLAGATEEHESGFVAATTAEGLAEIMGPSVQMAPFLADAQLVHHVAGLRPGTPDELPLVGPVPGWEGLYITAGHFRRGMELSMGSARVIADLVLGRPSPISLAPFDPGRFGSKDGAT
jgi:glycine oxidase